MVGEGEDERGGAQILSTTLLICHPVGGELFSTPSFLSSLS
jgi:hypothetical protein